MDGGNPAAPDASHDLDAGAPRLIPVDLFEVFEDRGYPGCEFESTECFAQIEFVTVPECVFDTRGMSMEIYCPEAMCGTPFQFASTPVDDLGRVVTRGGGGCRYEREDCRGGMTNASIRTRFDRATLEEGLGCEVPVP